MQKNYYDNEGITGNMNKENHSVHNDNPDYWNILVKDTENEEFKSKIGLDFGCGCGRNVMNLIKRFKRMDGVDISPYLVQQTIENLKSMNAENFKIYTCDGVSLNTIPDNEYDFVMSTIVLQHICVYDIRLHYLEEFYRVMRSGGILSFQMGFGPGHQSCVNYIDNFYDAKGTNSCCDVRVISPQQIIDDLFKIGFVDITYQICNSWSDSHSQWIYIRAIKK